MSSYTYIHTHIYIHTCTHTHTHTHTHLSIWIVPGISKNTRMKMKHIVQMYSIDYTQNIDYQMLLT